MMVHWMCTPGYSQRQREKKVAIMLPAVSSSTVVCTCIGPYLVLRKRCEVCILLLLLMLQVWVEPLSLKGIWQYIRAILKTELDCSYCFVLSLVTFLDIARMYWHIPFNVPCVTMDLNHTRFLRDTIRQSTPWSLSLTPKVFSTWSTKVYS